MNPAALAVALSLLYTYVFWLLYLVVMGLYRAHLKGQLVGASKLLAYPVVIVGVLVDWLANMVLATIVFQELPGNLKELVTQRLARYIKEPEGRNQRWAKAICVSLLDPFDPTGAHCT